MLILNMLFVNMTIQELPALSIIWKSKAQDVVVAQLLLKNNSSILTHFNGNVRIADDYWEEQHALAKELRVRQ